MNDVLRGTYHERLNRVLDHLERHLDEDPRLADLADVACFSAHHFHRIFTGMVGESVRAHVRRLRLQRASHRLLFTDMPVTDAALDAGYESLEAFTRAFKAQFGLPPGRWRDAARAGDVASMAGPDRLPQGRIAAAMREGGFAMEVDIRQLPEMRVAYVRHVGPYEQCCGAWEALCAWAGPRGLFGPDSRFVGVCHDDPESTPPERIRYDACLVVGDEVRPEGPVGVKTVGGHECAVVLHEGPYENLHKTYAYLCGAWGQDSGREFAPEASYEFYLNDPGTTPAEELRTEICVPLV